MRVRLAVQCGVVWCSVGTHEWKVAGGWPSIARLNDKAESGVPLYGDSKHALEDLTCTRADRNANCSAVHE